MHQGSRDDKEANRELLIDPKTIDAVLLTHAHIDHSGRIPMLYAHGYNGNVFMSSSPTSKIAFLQCQNSAKLMFQQYETDLSRAKKTYSAVKKAEELLNSSKRDKQGNRVGKTITEEERRNAIEFVTKHADITSSSHKPKKPIYSEEDVNSMLIHSKDIEEFTKFIPCVSIKTTNAAHVLGSRSIILTFKKKMEIKE